MLTIKKSSLIGRYYEWIMERTAGWQVAYNKWHNLSLCLFVQRLFWRTLLLIVVILVIIFVISVFILTLLSPILYYFLGIKWFQEIVPIGFFTWGIIIVVLGIFILKKLSQKYAQKEKIASSSPIIWEYLKAKKIKICPLIKIEE